MRHRLAVAGCLLAFASAELQDDAPPSAPPSRPPWKRAGAASATARPRPRPAIQRWARSANVANGALLLLSGAPVALRAGLLHAHPVNLLLGGWVSAFGVLVLMAELRLAPVQRWLRRNFGFLFSGGGRNGLLLCAASMSLAAGPIGALPALATVANIWIGNHARSLERLRRVRMRAAAAAAAQPQRLSAPVFGDGVQAEYTTERGAEVEVEVWPDETEADSASAAAAAAAAAATAAAAASAAAAQAEVEAEAEVEARRAHEAALAEDLRRAEEARAVARQEEARAEERRREAREAEERLREVREALAAAEAEAVEAAASVAAAQTSMNRTAEEVGAMLGEADDEEKLEAARAADLGEAEVEALEAREAKEAKEAKEASGPLMEEVMEDEVEEEEEEEVESEPEPPPQEPPVRARRCEDRNPSCRSWAKEGECESNANYMAESCPASCGSC